MEAIPISTNDLLRHVEIQTQLHGNEVAWVRSISGAPSVELVSIGLGTLILYGRTDVVRERLAALLAVLDSAIAQPELWPDLKLRESEPGHWTRDKPSPFVALGTGPAGPKLVRPIAARGPKEGHHVGE